MSTLKMGEIYRLPSPAQYDKTVVDSLPNFYAITGKQPDGKGFIFQRGIHVVKEVQGPDGIKRIPVIIISSTPRKAGSEDTPWHDVYDSEHGYIRYFGDNNNKIPDRKPHEYLGNKTLLENMQFYECDSKADRLNNAIPLIFLEKITYNKKPKGYAIFHGFGVIDSVELVTQYDVNHKYFSNYLYTFTVFSLADENDQFNWQWILDRCDPSKTTKETMVNAPKSWKTWINGGKEVIHKVRRNVFGGSVQSEKDQRPTNTKLLQRIYDYYSKTKQSKYDFEYLALEVTSKAIEENGGSCKPGWITSQSGDGGIDFVMRLDVGKGILSSVNVIIIGQAKCEKMDTPTNGVHIARTVARLKRGWISSYVTTSYFSEAVQQEVKEDGYPIMLINGAKIVSIVEKELFESQMTLEEYLASLKDKYDQKQLRPEDILFM